jgi:hypothetical protein
MGRSTRQGICVEVSPLARPCCVIWWLVMEGKDELPVEASGGTVRFPRGTVTATES